MTQTNTRPGGKGPHKGPRKPRRIGTVGQAYLEAQERQQQERRKNAARAMRLIGGGAK